MFSFKQFIVEAGVIFERQETSFINAIKNAIKTNNGNPINLVAGDVEIKNIKDVGKYTGRQISGSEPYTDVVIKTSDNKEINCSLKGESAPSLAGGGLKGLEVIVPGIAAKFMHSAFDILSKKIKPGDKVPDVYGEIQERDKLKIVVGTKEIGGPIDFMYIGKMDIESHYDHKSNTLTFSNGRLIPAQKFAHEHKLYFRLRARREDQRFDPTAKDIHGVPKIYGRSPSKGDSAGRIVVVDKVPSNATIIDVK